MNMITLQTLDNYSFIKQKEFFWLGTLWSITETTRWNSWISIEIICKSYNKMTQTKRKKTKRNQNKLKYLPFSWNNTFWHTLLRLAYLTLKNKAFANLKNLKDNVSILWKIRLSSNLLLTNSSKIKELKEIDSTQD